MAYDPSDVVIEFTIPVEMINHDTGVLTSAWTYEQYSRLVGPKESWT
jgi:hypothetical protein